MDNLIDLIVNTWTVDSIGQRVPTTVTRSIFCRTKDVTRSEWYSGGHAGRRPELTVEVFSADYEGEEQAVVNGKEYTIYRTHHPEGSDYMELYLERRARNG